MGRGQNNVEEQSSAKSAGEKKKLWQELMNILVSLSVSEWPTNDDLPLNTHFSHIWIVYKKMLFPDWAKISCFVRTHFYNQELTETGTGSSERHKFSWWLGWELFNSISNILCVVMTISQLSIIMTVDKTRPDSAGCCK